MACSSATPCSSHRRCSRRRRNERRLSYEATFNLFFKLKYNKLYDAVLATPVTPVDVVAGEIGWALMRGVVLLRAAFLLVMLVMGLIVSWWALLALPAVVLIGFAFAVDGNRVHDVHEVRGRTSSYITR